MLEQVRCLLTFCDQFRRWNRPQSFSGIGRLPHVHLNHPAADLPNSCDRFAGVKMKHFLEIERLVLLAPTDRINGQHG